MTAALDTVSQHMGAVLTGQAATNTDSTQDIPGEQFPWEAAHFGLVFTRSFAALDHTLSSSHLCFITGI